MGSRILGGRGLRHRRRAAVAVAVGVLALVVGVVTAGIGQDGPSMTK